MDWPLRFGAFIAPFHPDGQNPTLALDRDLELVATLDRLGFDEAWIGEHHSGGYEIIASPEVFIAVAAERTKNIRLGTGVVSLPYHHPFNVAQRIVQLGGEPDFSPGRLVERSHADYDESTDLKAMIRANLVAERVAIEAYTQMIHLIGDKDSTTRRMLEGILSQEQEHADELSDWMTA